MYLQQNPTPMQAWPAVLAAVAARCSTRGGVPLLTVTEAKGHEYDHVLVYDTADTTFRSKTDAPDVERNRYYVACTRARKSLTLFRPAREPA
ncbi:3'-5' exonuclease [Advenella kashmirensis]|uniref:3'-5' exonuclease n=1 Tax=Advenella kashmirensis TaxID=310575 RepID=UPI0005A21366|nr:3'-5' exonuclease [Advenella kashmirensis]